MADETRTEVSTHASDAMERLEHEIEELEHPQGTWVRWAILGLLGLVIIGAFWIIKGSHPKSPLLAVPPMTGDLTPIEMFEPPAAKLAAAPVKFRWQSISGTKGYILRILPKDKDEPLLEKTLKSASAELTSEEAARLRPGATYIWEVTAHTANGAKTAGGRAAFAL